MGALIAVLCLAGVAGRAEEKPVVVDPPVPAADAPVIGSIIPNWSTLDEPADVTIRGKGFLADPARRPPEVLVDGQRVANVKVISPSELRVKIPASDKAGWVKVQVRNPDGQSHSIDPGFHHGPLPRTAVQTVMMRLEYFRERFSMGGGVMYAILALSVFGVAWFFHCLAYLRPSRLMPESLVQQVNALLASGNVTEAQRACEREQSALARLALAGLRHAGDDPQKIIGAIEAAGSRESAYLFQKVHYLANIGVISPMLGLFGTVLGMILVFDGIANQEGAQHIMLAGGISKALYTTAFGLMVGIPAMCCYYYLRGRAVRIVTDLEEKAEQLARSMPARRG